jgi:hypothetical protein
MLWESRPAVRTRITTISSLRATCGVSSRTLSIQTLSSVSATTRPVSTRSKSCRGDEGKKDVSPTGLEKRGAPPAAWAARITSVRATHRDNTAEDDAVAQSDAVAGGHDARQEGEAPARKSHACGEVDTACGCSQDPGQRDDSKSQ